MQEHAITKWVFAATVKSESCMSNIYNMNIKINRIRVQKLPVL